MLASSMATCSSEKGALDAVVSAVGKRRRSKRKADADDDTLPWHVFVEYLLITAPGVDPTRVCEFIQQPVVVDVDGDEAESEMFARQVVVMQHQVANLLTENVRLKRKGRASAKPTPRQPQLTETSLNVCPSSSLALAIFRGTPHSHFDPRSSMAITNRSLSSGVSARRLGLSCSMQVATTTVCHKEVHYAAAVQASRKARCYDRQHLLYECSGVETRGGVETKYRFTHHLIRSDATSTKNRTNSRTAQVKGWYYEADVGDGTAWEVVQSACEAACGEADVIVVGGGSVEDSYAMYGKQVGSVGCPHCVRSPSDWAKGKECFAKFKIMIVIAILVGQIQAAMKRRT